MNTLLSEYLNIMTEDGNSSDTEEPDTAGPIINLQTSSTENTITVIVTATDESGLAEEETYTYYLNSVQQGVATTESTKTYTGLTASTEYTIKVLVKDALGNESEKEIKVSTTEPEVPDMGEAKPNPDQDGPEYSTTTTIQDDLGNSVVIPGGFHLDAESGTKVEEGIVIEDANGNQFVWIPTGTYQTSSGAKTNNLARRTFTSSGATEVTADNGDGVVENYFYGEGSTQYTSVAKDQIASFKANASPKSEANQSGKGGFYIGRYEQGEGNVCKNNQTPYVNLKRDTAKSQAEAMYGEESSVVSELISSYAWDTALNFICQTNGEGYTLATTTSPSYGNIGTYNRKNTGVDTNDYYSKIHDLLGNCYEWTTEYPSNSMTPCVFRGGSYYNSRYYAATRFKYDASYSRDYLSFRVQVYVK